MANIYDTINQLERDVRELDQFKELKEAMNKVASDEEAYKLYDEFRQFQMALQTKFQAGTEPDETDMKKSEELQKKIEGNEIMSDLLTKEQALNRILDDVTNAITRPIREMYQQVQPKG